MCVRGRCPVSNASTIFFSLYHRHKAMLLVYVYVNSILFIHSLILSGLIVLLIRCVCYEVKIKKKKMEKIFMKIKSMHPIYLFSFFFLIFCMSSSNRQKCERKEGERMFTSTIMLIFHTMAHSCICIYIHIISDLTIVCNNKKMPVCRSIQLNIRSTRKKKINHHDINKYTCV